MSENTIDTGIVLISGTASNLLEQNAISRDGLVRRHARGDHGQLDEHEAAMNDYALDNRGEDGELGGRVLSCYIIEDQPVWIVTKWDCTETRIMLPSEVVIQGKTVFDEPK